LRPALLRRELYPYSWRRGRRSLFRIVHEEEEEEEEFITVTGEASTTGIDTR
jgi:hypothetical protein